ncbi:helix-turn-helix transcriptional regulator [Lentzea sp.]|uniref:helix-turn-helix domain-containing protein n=1 Tax=Lentzea sp. TaxID=56099 RepID=UPI002ED094F0
MIGDPSTPYSRDLGDELRQVRERCTTFRGRKIARMLGWDPGKVSNIENGKVRATEIDLVQYLGRCGKSQEFVLDFLDRYRSAFDHYFVQAPGRLGTLSMEARGASTGPDQRGCSPPDGPAGVPAEP